MKIYIYSIFFLLGVIQFNFAQEDIVQKDTKASFEASVLGSDFVNRTSIGLSFVVNKNWHEYFQMGVGLQTAFNRQSNSFGYDVFTPHYTSTALTFNNTAQLYSLGKFSVEANANFGWLFINLQDEDLAEYNPAFDIFQPATIARETFRMLQGGITLNYVIKQRETIAIAIFARVLKNQAFGNVRFGGADANSNFQFNIGVKLIAF